MIVIVEGVDLPGRRCQPDPEGHGHENVHVGVCAKAGKRTGVEALPGRPWGVTGLVPGDAPAARWELDVEVRRRDGALDFAGPYVRGNLDDRHVGLAWGEVGPDGAFELFRAAKLRFDTVAPTLIRDASRPGRALVARVGLTDATGNPRCASVRPPDIAWTVQPV